MQSGWTKEDGPFPGVWKGGKCLWACTWITSWATVTPRMYAPLESLPAEGAIFEFLEYAKVAGNEMQREGGAHLVGKARTFLNLLLELRNVEMGSGNPIGFMAKLKKNMGGNLGEYIWCYETFEESKAFGGQIVHKRYRPGFPKPPKIERPLPVAPEGYRLAS